MFPHAYPLEFVHVISAALGVIVNLFTWVMAKIDLGAAEVAVPFSPERVKAGKITLRREYVSLVYVQGLMLAIGVMSLFTAPPPWAWGDLQWRFMTQDQRGAQFYAWLWRVAITTMCVRKMFGSLQNYFDERALRRGRPKGAAAAAQVLATDAQVVATAAQVVAGDAQTAANVALAGDQMNKEPDRAD